MRRKKKLYLPFAWTPTAELELGGWRWRGARFAAAPRFAPKPPKPGPNSKHQRLKQVRLGTRQSEVAYIPYPHAITMLPAATSSKRHKKKQHTTHKTHKRRRGQGQRKAGDPEPRDQGPGRRGGRRQRQSQSLCRRPETRERAACRASRLPTSCMPVIDLRERPTNLYSFTLIRTGRTAWTSLLLDRTTTASRFGSLLALSSSQDSGLVDSSSGRERGNG
jgi:hypothetical protein